VLTVSLELWLFAVVMEVIVIGTFFGGTVMAYRIGKRQSAAVPEHVQASISICPQQTGVSGAPTEREDRSAPAA
jgi:hypothetical protein